MDNNIFYSSKLENLKSMYETMAEKNNNRISMALKKIENYLISKEMIHSTLDIKKMKRIEVKGVAENGKERLIQTEIEEKYGLDVLEDNASFNILYPIIENGVIK